MEKFICTENQSHILKDVANCMFERIKCDDDNKTEIEEVKRKLSECLAKAAKEDFPYWVVKCVIAYGVDMKSDKRTCFSVDMEKMGIYIS